MHVEDHFRNNIKLHGADAIKQKAVEELAELIVAITHDGNVAEEMADVIIMIRQLMLIYDCKDATAWWYRWKIKRQRYRNIEETRKDDRPH